MCKDNLTPWLLGGGMVLALFILLKTLRRSSPAAAAPRRPLVPIGPGAGRAPGAAAAERARSEAEAEQKPIGPGAGRAPGAAAAERARSEAEAERDRRKAELEFEAAEEAERNQRRAAAERDRRAAAAERERREAEARRSGKLGSGVETSQDILEAMERDQPLSRTEVVGRVAVAGGELVTFAEGGVPSTFFGVGAGPPVFIPKPELIVRSEEELVEALASGINPEQVTIILREEP